MRIYAPNPDLEFQAIVGGLTEEEFGLIEALLNTEALGVRYVKELDRPIFPDIQRFTLKVHRDARATADDVIHKVQSPIFNPFSRVRALDCSVAALVRQRIRAGEDKLAAESMMHFLLRELERLCASLLHGAATEKAVDLWFDGITALEEKPISPLEISIRGAIYAGRASDSDEDRHPIEARLRSSPQGPYLDQCLVRIGDRPRFIKQSVMPAELNLEYTDDNQFTVRIGEAVPRIAGQAIEWAIEIENTPGSSQAN